VDGDPLNSLRLADALWFAIAFEAALLGTGGVLHLLGPHHLARAAAEHRAAGAVPTWLGRFERPRLIGSVELGLAALVLGAGCSGRRELALAVQICVLLTAAALVAFVSVLHRSDARVTCGCHPLAGEIGATSYLPGAALFVAAALSVAAIGAAGTATTLPAAASMAMLGALTAFTSLVYAGAASAHSSEPAPARER
jgi:hypothetical protein